MGGAGLGFPGQWEVGGSGRSRALVGAGLGFPGLLWGGFNRRGYVGRGLNMDNRVVSIACLVSICSICSTVSRGLSIFKPCPT